MMWCQWERGTIPCPSKQIPPAFKAQTKSIAAFSWKKSGLSFARCGMTNTDRERRSRACEGLWIVDPIFIVIQKKQERETETEWEWEWEWIKAHSNFNDNSTERSHNNRPRAFQAKYFARSQSTLSLCSALPHGQSELAEDSKTGCKRNRETIPCLSKQILPTFKAQTKAIAAFNWKNSGLSFAPCSMTSVRVLFCWLTQDLAWLINPLLKFSLPTIHLVTKPLLHP